jgi:hypothetical protein
MAEDKKKEELQVDKETTGERQIVQADILLDEFELPLNELLDQFKTGDSGKVLVPVDVLRVDNEKVRFKKKGSAETYGSFKERPLEEVREDIGVAED